MKITAVDTCVLLDILIPNQRFIDNSLKKIINAANEGIVIVCDLVFAELSSQFNTINVLNKFLMETHLNISTVTQESLFYAGKLWSSYKEDRNKKYYCPSCGSNVKTKCDNCQYDIESPRRLLNDFIIGAHATKQASGLLTRDRGFYRHYFKDLTIL
jgi:predicted nucleic acid-binding protein